MSNELEEKVIMVAAASKGLGYGIANACAEGGAALSIASRSENDIEQAAKTLRERHDAKVSAHVFDATNAQSIESWTEKTLSEFGRIDGLVINAGGPPAGTFDTFDDQSWQKAFELTLLSSVRMIRAVLPTMRSQERGAVVTITSSSVREPNTNLLLSNVFRSGVASLVKSLAKEAGKDGIRFNNLVPGRIDTDRVKSLDEGIAQKLGSTSANVRKEQEASIPLGRYGEIEEFGKAGAFLLSDSASYVNGSTLLVDGGKASSIW